MKKERPRSTETARDKMFCRNDLFAHGIHPCQVSAFREKIYGVRGEGRYLTRNHTAFVFWNAREYKSYLKYLSRFYHNLKELDLLFPSHIIMDLWDI